MAKSTLARKGKVSTGRSETVSKSDFSNPDSSLLGLTLQRLAATLTLLDDLQCEALQIDYSDIGRSFGMDRRELRYCLTESAIETAARDLAKAREALHDLFREVELKAKPAVA